MTQENKISQPAYTTAIPSPHHFDMLFHILSVSTAEATSRNEVIA